MSVYNTLHFVLSHPLNRRRRIASIARVLRWQIGSRLLRWAVAVPFVNQTQLLVEQGMSGATGNVYCGLHEFEEMGFTLHLLRPGDVFVDLGANIGSYALLGAAAGADVYAYEPGSHAHARLVRNVALNGFTERVRLRNAAVGERSGMARLTLNRDTGNRIERSSGREEQSESVEMIRLDDEPYTGCPFLMKIDVEGFELPVLTGSEKWLADNGLAAVIVETNGSARHYGGNDEGIHRILSAHGFAPFRYDPFTRSLEARSEQAESGNTLYVRDPNLVRARLSSSHRYRLNTGHEI